MAFTGVTPEALMARSDSRNPATTCKGLTKSGRPCRRPIDAKADDGSGGVVAVSSLADNSDEDDVGAAAFFCWQHKNQAERLAAQATPGPATQLYPLQERSSIDTLVQRLGVLDVNEPSAEERRKKKSSGKPPRRLNRPPTWGQVQGPLMSVPSDVMAQQRKDNRRKRPKKKKQGFLSRLCCGEADDEDMEAIRQKKRRDHAAQQQQQQQMQMQQQQRPQTPEPKPVRHTNADYIPSTLSPDLASTLLAELEKPISLHDEPGYIYIFWLTPEESGPAPSRAASDLLTPPTRAGHSRRTSDVMRQYSVKNSGASRGVGGAADDKKDTILLKIGRANNVTRRMNEWTRQCGYSLSLVRFYPYVSSSSTPSPAPSPGRAGDAHDGVRKVPNVNRVERLVHLELGAQRVLRKCEACGKEHREWFEVEASKNGVKMVDEVIKRWVEWAEAHADS